VAMVPPKAIGAVLEARVVGHVDKGAELRIVEVRELGTELGNRRATIA
jgi:hypothetical protein